MEAGRKAGREADAYGESVISVAESFTNMRVNMHALGVQPVPHMYTFVLHDGGST